MRALPAVWAAVIVITAGFAVVAWSGIEQFKSSGGDDEVAFRAYVAELDTAHHLPRRGENDEYSLPPGVPALAIEVNRAFAPIVPNRASPVLQGLPRLLRRLLWLALVAGGAALIARARPLAPRWLIGVGLWLAAAGLAWVYVNTAVDNEAWLPLVLIDFVSAVALVPVTALLAHEVWPHSRSAPVLGALGAVLLPPVFAAALYFHPDPPFALLASAAALLALRAVRKGLTVRAGVALGIVLGAAALTRQSAPVIAASLLIGVLLIARRQALRYVVACAAAMLLVAGAWWYHQARLYGNPVQSNLDRAGYMLDHQPRGFYVSLPVDLIVRPRYYSFENKLLPRFHAYLWSDWSGGYHNGWDTPKRYATTLVSIQSVLGFGGDALVLGGVALLGLPALVRVVRRTGGGTDAPLAILTTLFVLAWTVFVVTLIRFPQKGGDPIKVHYLLFLAPVSIVFAIASARSLVRRGGPTRIALSAWVAAYAVSWVLTLATAF